MSFSCFKQCDYTFVMCWFVSHSLPGGRSVYNGMSCFGEDFLKIYIFLFLCVREGKVKDMYPASRAEYGEVFDSP